jgi:hypothetical protein
LKIKNSKNSLDLVILVLRYLKTCLGLGLRNLKRGSYEVAARVRVCD